MMTTNTTTTPAVGHPDTITAPEAPAIPGLWFRHYRGLDDIPGMAEVADAANRAAGSADTRSVETMLAQYRNLENCDPDQDIVVVEADGRTVAYQRTMWADRAEGTRGFVAVAFVDPDQAGRGIEDALLAIGIRRQVELAAELAGRLPARPAILVRYARGPRPDEVARLEQAGFRPVRRYAELVRPDFEALPVIAPPAGIELRRIDPADEAAIRRGWDVATEVFADSWGEGAPSEAEWRKFRESPECQPALWCVAFDPVTGEVAGQILNYLGPTELDGSIIGWTESIGVRAPFRRRGLASAMLAESLRIVRDAGATRAALGVDQQNPNEAQTLYERLGFRVTVEETEYHRPLELGEVGR
jgi:mycothiol synthase